MLVLLLLFYSIIPLIKLCVNYIVLFWLLFFLFLL
nr:MAG TPA: hypothetical protein [Caudoviricetes sp.]